MVIGGLTANMLFTRLVIPAGYLILERKKSRPPTAVSKAAGPIAPTLTLATGEGK
jgi:hypothetical protein